MSLSPHIYLGPHFECRNRPAGAIRHRGCVNPRCTSFHSYSASKYCPQCGSLVGDFDTGHQLFEIHWSDVSEAVNGSIRLGQCDNDDAAILRWIPNVSREGDPAIYVPNTDSVAKMVTPQDIAPQIVWLDQAFADERAKLAEFFGEKSVTTKWGLLVYWE